MKLWFILGAGLLSTPVWAQSAPGPGQGTGPGGPPPVKLTDAEEKAVSADLQDFQKQTQEWDQAKHQLDDQRHQLMDQDKPARADLETILRAQQDLAVKQELARFDLEMKWRETYGIEKARALMGRLPGPPGQGPPPPRD
jgi:hypothetical protein